MGKSKELATLKDGGAGDGRLTIEGATLGSTFENASYGNGVRVEQASYTADNYVSLIEAPYVAGYSSAGAHVRIGAKFNGSGSSLAMGTSNAYGSGITNTALEIDNVGRVTTPQRPAFRAWKDTTNWTVASTFVFDQTEYNIGGHYSTSTGRFTAPVAGIYHFDFYTIQYGSINNGYIRFWVNNARAYGGDVHFSPNSGNYWDFVSWHGDYKLDAGDYVQFISAQSHTFHGRHWSHFSGHLVG